MNRTTTTPTTMLVGDTLKNLKLNILIFFLKFGVNSEMKVFNGIIEKTAKKTEFFHRQKKDVFQKMHTVCLKPAHEKSVGANKVRGLQ